MRNVRAIYRQEDDGAWIGVSPEIPGYVAYGDTYEIARDRMREGLPWFAEEDDLVLVHIVPPSEAGKGEGAKVSFETTQQPRSRFSASLAASATPPPSPTT